MAGKSESYQISPAAEGDLEAIWLYSAENWSSDQADSYHMKIVKAFEALASGLKVGRPVSVKPGYLKYPVESHVVYFRAADEGIQIIRVLHQRQDAEKYL